VAVGIGFHFAAFFLEVPYFGITEGVDVMFSPEDFLSHQV
jgi:hypothetical protein